MIRDYSLQGEESGVELTCDKSCVILEGNTWKQQLEHCKQCVVFIDEGNHFVSSKEFATTIQKTDNYYVLVTRESLSSLPYSIEEIYGIRTNGKYGGLRQTFNEIFQIYTKDSHFHDVQPSIIVTEDSNSGYQFFQRICEEINVKCVCAMEKSNMAKEILKYRNEKVLMIADGAEFLFGKECQN